MTGYRSKHFRHMCAERGCYIDLLPSWDDIIECLPRNIRPTDVDGAIESNGHFLWVEEKSAGKSIEYGQSLFLRRLGEQPNTTVVVIRPVAGSPTGMQALWLPNPNGFQDITRDEFLDWVTDWASYTTAHPPKIWRYTERFS